MTTVIDTTLDASDRAELARCRTTTSDGRSRRWLFGSFVLHAVALAIFFFAPPSSSALTSDLVAADVRYVHVTLPAIERSMPPRSPTTSPSPESEPEGVGSDAPVVMRETRAHARPHAALDADRTRASLDVLRSSLGSLSSHVGSPFVVTGLDALANGAASLDVPGIGLGMRGVGHGTGNAPTDVVVGFGLGMRGFGISCTEEHVLPSGTLVAASCQGGMSNGSTSHGFGAMASRGFEVPETHTCGGPCANDVRGGLTREQVRRVVIRQRGQIAHCYAQSLLSRPDRSGRVTTRFVVAPDGHVAISTLDDARSDLAAPEVESCITAAVRRWTFPTADAPTSVSYPFVLSPA